MSLLTKLAIWVFFGLKGVIKITYNVVDAIHIS